MAVLKYRKRRSDEKIEWIVVHYPAMPNRSAYQVKDYFDRTNRAVSTHYIVDDNGWLNQTSTKYAAFHVGSLSDHEKKRNEDMFNGKEPAPYWMAHNGNSIGIDICDCKKCTNTCSVDDFDWYFTRKTLENTAALIAMLMKRHNIDINHVIRHYDVTGKRCPRPFVGCDESCNNPGCTCFDVWEDFKKYIIDFYFDTEVCHE